MSQLQNRNPDKGKDLSASTKRPRENSPSDGANQAKKSTRSGPIPTRGSSWSTDDSLKLIQAKKAAELARKGMFKHN